VPDFRVLAALGELVVDLLPVPEAGAGREGTAPQYVARPGGNALLLRETPSVSVDDTAGAGDSPAAGVLTGLLGARVTSRAALGALPDEDLLALVDDAAPVAALTCTRVGADPPTRAELDAARAAR
jgi:fructokinase